VHALQALRKGIVSLLPPRLKGRLEYHVRPALRASWGGPLNGQKFRQEIVIDLLQKLRPVRVLETGTFRGTTTEFFANSPDVSRVDSVEANDRSFGFAAERFRFSSKVRLTFGDSRKALSVILATSIKNDRFFVYLDAHWGDDIPLAEEVHLLLRSRHPCIIMVDDFRVPHDPGYGYDDYGSGKELTSDYLFRNELNLSLYYPAVDSSQETGARRGCTVFATDSGLEPLLASSKLLSPRL
jgi:hypothetical protein